MLDEVHMRPAEELIFSCFGGSIPLIFSSRVLGVFAFLEGFGRVESICQAGWLGLN